MTPEETARSMLSDFKLRTSMTAPALYEEGIVELLAEALKRAVNARNEALKEAVSELPTTNGFMEAAIRIRALKHKDG